MKPTLLVTGSNGLLSRKLIGQALEAYRVVGCSEHPSTLPYREVEFHQVDVRDGTAVSRLFETVRPDIVVHTAAMTNVDACELHPGDAQAVNVDGTAHVVRGAQAAGAHLIFLSTDYVFSGDAGPYEEGDPPHPLSVYGQTKLQGEHLVLDALPSRAAVARTSILYGHAPGARPNFVTWLVQRLQDGKPLSIVTDQVGSPTLADNLAEMLLAIAGGRHRGIFHTAGAEWLSRYDFSVRIAAQFGLDAGLLTATETASLRQPAPRPRHSGLVVTGTEKRLGVRALDVEGGLRSMLGQWRPISV